MRVALSTLAGFVVCAACASPRPTAVVRSSAAPAGTTDVFGTPLDAGTAASPGEAAPLLHHGEPTMVDSVLGAAERRVDEAAVPAPNPIAGNFVWNRVESAPSVEGAGKAPFGRGAAAAALAAVDIES